MSKHLFLWFYLLAFFTSAANAEEINEKVNAGLGMQLVKLAIYGTPYQGASFGVPPENRQEVFLVYQILGKYKGTVAWIAVNPWTGDVWNMNKCSLFTNRKFAYSTGNVKK